jgi:retron-type reverse transcriptase
MEENFRMVTFDIKDLYVHIPIKETLSITKALLLEHNNEHITKQIISLLDIILQQNYFISQNNNYQPEKGISMGSPISGIVAEIFLQHLENSHLSHTLEAKNIVF